MKYTARKKKGIEKNRKKTTKSTRKNSQINKENWKQKNGNVNKTKSQDIIQKKSYYDIFYYGSLFLLSFFFLLTNLTVCLSSSFSSIPSRSLLPSSAPPPKLLRYNISPVMTTDLFSLTFSFYLFTNLPVYLYPYPPTLSSPPITFFRLLFSSYNGQTRCRRELTHCGSLFNLSYSICLVTSAYLPT